LLRFSARSSIG